MTMKLGRIRRNYHVFANNELGSALLSPRQAYLGDRPQPSFYSLHFSNSDWGSE